MLLHNGIRRFLLLNYYTFLYVILVFWFFSNSVLSMLSYDGILLMTHNFFLSSGKTFPVHVHTSQWPLDRHAKHPIIGYQQTIIRIIRPIISEGRRLMLAPASHATDMMGPLEEQEGGDALEGSRCLNTLSTGLRCGWQMTAAGFWSNWWWWETMMNE